MLLDQPRELVSEDDGLAGASEALIADPDGQIGPLVGSVPGVEIRTTDPAALHPDPDLPRSCLAQLSPSGLFFKHQPGPDRRWWLGMGRWDRLNGVQGGQILLVQMNVVGSQVLLQVID
jgi:hypothetical protein